MWIVPGYSASAIHEGLAGGNAPQSLWQSNGSNFRVQISLAEILAWPILVPGCQKGLVHLQVGSYCNLFDVKCQTQLSLKTFTLSVTVNQSGQGKTRGLTVNTLTSLLGIRTTVENERTTQADRMGRRRRSNTRQLSHDSQGPLSFLRFTTYFLTSLIQWHYLHSHLSLRT